METITDITAWVRAHWADLVALYTGLVTVASLFVKLTPTLRDDTALLAITKWVSRWLALNPTVDHKAVRANGG